VENFESEFQETFKRILPCYFESGSKIGISLTGGLDTRMIMACRPKAAEQAVCYTFSGENGQTLDDRLAKRVAETCGLAHRILRIGQDFFSNFASHADRTVYATDGCFGVLGAHEIYLNKQARYLAPVRLTGNYGSEILRGVSTFKPLALSPNLFNPEFRRSLTSSTRLVANDNEHPVTSAAFREIPWNLFGSLAAGRSQVSFRTPYLDNKIVALAYQAPGTLRASPLPAVNLVKDNAPSLYNIPTDMGEMGKTRGLACPLRRFYSKATFKLDYLNNEGFPLWLSPLDPVFQGLASSLKIVGLHKYLHYRSWFRKELAGYVTGMLKDSRIRQSPFWNPDFLENMAKDHIRGRKNYVREIHAVLTVEAVERLLFRDLPYEMSDPKNSWAKGLQKEPLLTR
jgi:asparagine synthase (glutamine-hydrolysing)